ncbi:MAG TPA: helix-turn-helix domain-containing protein [Terriglobales bacterium]|nr:helix-turn-helix domain-containing protein [Terriglobales bacterium]
MGTSYLQNNNFPSLPSLPVESDSQSHPPLEAQKAPPEEPIQIAAIPVNRCVTTEQAAEILGRSVDVVKKWRKQKGKGPAFIRYPDGGIRYRLSVLMKFLDDCTVTR